MGRGSLFEFQLRGTAIREREIVALHEIDRLEELPLRRGVEILHLDDFAGVRDTGRARDRDATHRERVPILPDRDLHRAPAGGSIDHDNRGRGDELAFEPILRPAPAIYRLPPFENDPLPARLQDPGEGPLLFRLLEHRDDLQRGIDAAEILMDRRMAEPERLLAQSSTTPEEIKTPEDIPD